MDSLLDSLQSGSNQANLNSAARFFLFFLAPGVAPAAAQSRSGRKKYAKRPAQQIASTPTIILGSIGGIEGNGQEKHIRRDEAGVKLAKHKSGTRIGYGCVPPHPVTVSSSPPPPLESKFLGFPSPLTGSKNLRGIKALLPHLFRRHTLCQLDLVSQLLQIMGGFISSRLDLGVHCCALCVPYWLLCKIRKEWWFSSENCYQCDTTQRGSSNKKGSAPAVHLIFYHLWHFLN